ncbi:Zinc finger protein pat-9 [Aphelenchoides fujianensis]|nr:Zinc finger protein pat-9 [Aphelenchoides fujianensis]
MEMEIHQMPPNHPLRHAHLHHHHYPAAPMYDAQQPHYPHIVAAGQQPAHHSLLLNDLYPPAHAMLPQPPQQPLQHPEVKLEPLEMLGPMDGAASTSPGHSLQPRGSSPSKMANGSPQDASPSHALQPPSSVGYDLLAPIGVFDSKAAHLLPAEFPSPFDSAAVAAAVELATSVAAASVPSAPTTKSAIRTHDRKRPYPCTHCDSKFGSKMELEEHTNSHSGLKPFECDICQSRFNRRSTLWNHKRIHSDAKPFSCTVCHMTFKWKNSLKCHKEMHQRKNETVGQVDQDIKNLTYATAAKKQKAEKNGAESTIAVQPHPQQATKKKGGGKKATKKQQRELSLALAASGQIGGFSVNLLDGMDHLGRDEHAVPGDDDRGGETTAADLLPTAAASFDLAHLNSNHLLMQAICNSNPAASTAPSTAAPVRQLTADETAAMEFVSAQLSLEQQQSLRQQQQQQAAAAAAMTSPIGAQQPAAHPQQPPADSTPAAASFFSQLDSFCPTSAAAGSIADAQQSLRFPQFFESVNVFDFHPFAERNQQLVPPYTIGAAATSSCPAALESIHAPAVHQQNPMLSQHRTDMLDMQHLYQPSFDPALFLNQSQHQSMDYMQFDCMLNGAPVYPQFAAPQMAGHPSMGFASAPPAAQLPPNASMEQLSQEELQNIAKIFPCDKWP